MEKLKMWANENPEMIIYFLGMLLIVLIVYMIMKPSKKEESHPKKQKSTIVECNNEILQFLTKYLEDNPKTHFGQALLNIGIIETGEKNGKKFTINPGTISSYQLLTRIRYRNVERILAEDI